MKTNAAFLAGGGEAEVGLFRSNVMAFLTDADAGKLEAELQELQRYREMKRMRAVSLLGPDVEIGELAFIWRKWLYEYLRIILKHADDSDLFQTERIGGF